MSFDTQQGRFFDDSNPELLLDKRPSSIGQTSIAYTPAREILTRATGFMDAYDFTLNPYSGCSFGCTYCYAAFFSRDVEKRDSWGYWVNVKENAVELMAKRKPGALDGKLIYMSSVTDAYQPAERELKLTRGILEIMADRHKPKLVIQTRSPAVVRDCDLFRQIEENGGRVQVNMTVTTDDEDVRRTFEPFCPSNMVRLRAIGEVQAAGIDTCITMTPLLLVSSPYAFADSLVETGVQKFIAQPFHFQRGKFLAGTRDKAFDLMAEKLGCDQASFREEYLEHYGMVFDVLRDTLPELGEGKDGFAPPF
ncbi:MAG: radical SAM protein [Dehalococcoidia bacterium]|nr:radical SAM protein [Dehalococcoidia bacterium]